jgi:amidase
MTVKRPSKEDIVELADYYGMHFSDLEVGEYQQLLADACGSYDRIDELEVPVLGNDYARDKGTAPAVDENPHNAWYWKSTIDGASAGPLKGKSIAIKDNICIAGIPMMNGSRALEGYIPDNDATVVTRILDAGGTILGKSTCEDLCLSGASFTSAPNPVSNPHDPTKSAGGSSSGSAVLVSIGAVDMALGGDQGGSIRMPASWTGVYGMKATHGLVPYTGVFPIELTLDHCGPMANTVQNVALLLSVVAGEDGHDPRQINVVTQDYMAALDQGVNGLKIGVLKEGFARPESEALVDAKVRESVEKLETLGASVKEISIPMHLDGPHIWNAIGFEGVTLMMMKGGSQGSNWNGHYLASLAEYYGKQWRERVDELSTTTKFVMLAGEYMQRQHPGVYYAKAQNLGNVLRAKYDEALEEVDLIVMPTTAMRAQCIGSPDLAPLDYVGKAFEMLGNTCPTDITHHPAMNVPCGMIDGLPVGMMLVGRHFDEASVIRAAAAFEKIGDWRNM